MIWAASRNPWRTIGYGSEPHGTAGASRLNGWVAQNAARGVEGERT